LAFTSAVLKGLSPALLICGLQGKMSPMSLTSIIAGPSCIAFLLSTLYWLREIGKDVNSTLPESQRIEWKLFETIPPFKMHWMWQEHVRLFPNSRKRICVAFSFLLFFLVPTVTLTVGLLRTGAP
jgi:hypothetical protein